VRDVADPRSFLPGWLQAKPVHVARAARAILTD
jgi:hypothetical protein